MFCNHTNINNEYSNINTYILTYQILSSILLTLSIALFFYFKRIKNNNIKNLYNLNVIFMCLCMFVYSFDPNGLNNIFPKWLVILLSDLTTCSGISIIFFFIYMSIFITCHLYYKNTYIKKIKIIQILIYIVILTLGLLQSTVNYKLFYSIKMFTYVFILLSVTIYFNISMKNLIYTVGEHIAYKWKINKLKRYMILYNILIFVIIGFQSYMAIINLLNKCKESSNIDKSDWIFLLFKFLSIILFWCFSIDWSKFMSCFKKEIIIPDLTSLTKFNRL